jgi:hypothetical protein
VWLPAGATLYIEPAELLELNNTEAQLADREAQAELAVLQVRGFLWAVSSVRMSEHSCKRHAWVH